MIFVKYINININNINQLIDLKFIKKLNNKTYVKL